MPGSTFLQGFATNNPNTIGSEWLEDDDPAAYYGAIPNAGGVAGRTAFQEYYRGAGQSRIKAQYLGSLGRKAASGGDPSQRYTDYLESYPWLKNFAELSPSARGESPTRFAPRVRFSG